MATVVRAEENRGLENLINMARLYRMYQQGVQEEHYRGQREYQLGRQLGRDDMMQSGFEKMGLGQSWLNKLSGGRFGQPGTEVTKIENPHTGNEYAQQQQAVEFMNKLIGKGPELGGAIGEIKTISDVVDLNKKETEAKKLFTPQGEIGTSYSGQDEITPQSIKGESYQEKKNNLFKDTQNFLKKSQSPQEKNDKLMKVIVAQRNLDDLYGRRPDGMYEDMYTNMNKPVYTGRGTGKLGKYYDSNKQIYFDERSKAIDPKTGKFFSGVTFAGPETGLSQEASRIKKLNFINKQLTPANILKLKQTDPKFADIKIQEWKRQKSVLEGTVQAEQELLNEAFQKKREGIRETIKRSPGMPAALVSELRKKYNLEEDKDYTQYNKSSNKAVYKSKINPEVHF